VAHTPAKSNIRRGFYALSARRTRLGLDLEGGGHRPPCELRELRVIDRMLTDEAPWVPMAVTLSTDFVGRRVGTYRYCWVSGGSGMTGACLDQLRVR
jgi:hypothetical protein